MTQYRALIDALVELGRGCVIAARIRATGHAERTNVDDTELGSDESRRKRVMLAMTPEQRDVVAELVASERIGAIHDVLANLPAHGVELAGAPLSDQADETPHWDFMARLDGEVWRADD